MERAIRTEVLAPKGENAKHQPPAKIKENLRRFVRAGWYITAAIAAAILFASIPGYVLSVQQELLPYQVELQAPIDQLAVAISAIMSFGVSLVSILLAGVIFKHRPDERMAMFVSFYLLVHGTVIGGSLEFLELYLDGSPDFVQRVIQPSVTTALGVAFLSLFPDGRFVPGWTRWLTLISLFWLPIPFFFDVFSLFDEISLLTVSTVLVAGGISLAALYAQYYRFRRVSSPEERQQIKWVVYGFGLMMLLILISSIPYIYYMSRPQELLDPWWHLSGSIFFWWPAMYIIPITLSISILRYRLWDIEIIINRTLVYGVLTALIAAIYMVVVGTLSVVFQFRGSMLVSLLGTGIVAVLFHPLRERLQRSVNRLLYGERDEPYTLLSRLGKRLEATLAPERVLPTITETVAQALKLPYVAIALKKGAEFPVATSYGAANQETMAYPLTYQGETVGQLIYAARNPGELLSKSEERLLEDVARQAGVAVHAVRLTTELQHSRQRLVAAREEERRRLRRDLHDELGSSLAALHLQTGVLRRLLDNNPQAAETVVAELRCEIREMIEEIRRLVYDLRPPALDELGLAGAIQNRAAHISRYGRNGKESSRRELQITVDSSADLPPLPAAIEVAAFRIAQEALTNVVRHAYAANCSVFIDLTSGHLTLEITDDGVGFTDEQSPGIGMVSMRERAEEMGGTCVVESRPSSGTRVFASLPLPGES